MFSLFLFATRNSQFAIPISYFLFLFLFPISYFLFPIPYFLFPIPIPIPYFLFPISFPSLRPSVSPCSLRPSVPPSLRRSVASSLCRYLETFSLILSIVKHEFEWVGISIGTRHAFGDGFRTNHQLFN